MRGALGRVVFAGEELTLADNDSIGMFKRPSLLLILFAECRLGPLDRVIGL